MPSDHYSIHLLALSNALKRTAELDELIYDSLAKIKSDTDPLLVSSVNLSRTSNSLYDLIQLYHKLFANIDTTESRQDLEATVYGIILQSTTIWTNYNVMDKNIYPHNTLSLLEHVTTYYDRIATQILQWFPNDVEKHQKHRHAAVNSERERRQIIYIPELNERDQMELRRAWEVISSQISVDELLRAEAYLKTKAQKLYKPKRGHLIPYRNANVNLDELLSASDGSSLFQIPSYKQIKNTLNYDLKSDPSPSMTIIDIEVLHNQAITLRNAGYREEAIAVMEKALSQFNPQSPSIFWAKRDVYIHEYTECVCIRSEDEEECRDAVRRLQELASTHVEHFEPYLVVGLINSSHTLHKLNLHDEALEYCLRAIHSLSRHQERFSSTDYNARALFLMSSIYTAKGENRDALNYAKKATKKMQDLAKIFPGNYQCEQAFYFFSLSECYSRMRDEISRIKALQRTEDALGIYRNFLTQQQQKKPNQQFPDHIVVEFLEKLISHIQTLLNAKNDITASVAVELAIHMEAMFGSSRDARNLRNSLVSTNRITHVGLKRIKTYEDRLAENRISLSRVLSRMGKFEIALGSAKRAADTYRTLMPQGSTHDHAGAIRPFYWFPSSHRENLRSALNEVLFCLRGLQRVPNKEMRLIEEELQSFW